MVSIWFRPSSRAAGLVKGGGKEFGNSVSGHGGEGSCGDGFKTGQCGFLKKSLETTS